MQVIISSGGVYHAYHAARGAAQAGVLKRFITGIYLKPETGIPPSLYRKILLPNYIGHAIQQIPGSHSQYISYLIRDNLFDWAASQMLADCDIFHGWNHMSLFTMRRAKRQGARTVIERSSAHPVWLDGMLRDEYRRHGLSFPAYTGQQAGQCIPHHVLRSSQLAEGRSISVGSLQATPPAQCRITAGRRTVPG